MSRKRSWLLRRDLVLQNLVVSGVILLSLSQNVLLYHGLLLHRVCQRLGRGQCCRSLPVLAVIAALPTSGTVQAAGAAFTLATARGKILGSGLGRPRALQRCFKRSGVACSHAHCLHKALVEVHDACFVVALRRCCFRSFCILACRALPSSALIINCTVPTLTLAPVSIAGHWRLRIQVVQILRLCHPRLLAHVLRKHVGVVADVCRCLRLTLSELQV